METAQDKYLDSHCSFRNDALDWLERQTNIRTNYPRMLSGRVQGGFLYMLSRMMRPANVLEIGTFTGYSAICLALGLPEGGHIDSLEVNDELHDLIEEGRKSLAVYLEMCREKGIDYEVQKLSMRYSGRFVAENEGADGICKILINKKKRKVK